MAVLDRIVLGLATAVMRSSFRRGGERRDGLAASYTIAVVGALVPASWQWLLASGRSGTFFTRAPG